MTRRARAAAAARYIVPCESHLDIGCGDGYFLRRSRARERIGIDRLLGDEVTTRLDFPDGSFDCVSMLAVIEHLKAPREVMREIHRVLKPGGRLVLTTPKRLASHLISIYAIGSEEEHEAYFDRDAIWRLGEGLLEPAGHHTFLLGLNQAFCLRKPGASRGETGRSRTAEP
jgi:SAM-dependent methyltransferase